MSGAQECEFFISVVLPCFNEEENIAEVAADMETYLQKFKQAEIVIVDDGSKDNTLSVIKEIQQKSSLSVKVLKLEKNTGLSNALYRGCLAASGDVIVTVDADAQYRANSIDNLLKKFTGGNVVCGYRIRRRDSIIKTVSSAVANFLGDLITTDKVRDAGCLFRVFPKSVAEEIEFFDGFHRFFATLARIKGYSVAEAGVEHFTRAGGVSKFNIRNRMFKALADAFKVRRMVKAKEAKEHE